MENSLSNMTMMKNMRYTSTKETTGAQQKAPPNGSALQEKMVCALAALRLPCSNRFLAVHTYPSHVCWFGWIIGGTSDFN